MTQTAEPAESAAPKPREPLIREITLRNFLSFGPDTEPLKLRPLNVLIGPNGSGKSNLIDAVAFLRASVSDLQEVTRRGGGVREWLWRRDIQATATMSVLVDGYDQRDGPLKHTIQFQSVSQALHLISERIDLPLLPNYVPYQYEQGKRAVLQHSPVIPREAKERLKPSSSQQEVNEVLIAGHTERIEQDASTSIVAEPRERTYAEIRFLAGFYKAVRIHRDWTFGRNTLFRYPQPADARSDQLDENYANLGLYLNRLGETPAAKRKLIRHLQDLYSNLETYDVIVQGNTVQVFLVEGDVSIPATRLSDGTLRYLCLLAILCDPEPPPLICLEEPELGLHPDILPGLARLLVEASERTQLIVTTHSEILVDALTEYPESIIVCEKHQGQTQMKRLNADDLSAWLEKYRLGDLWTSGQLGGNRW